MKGRYDVVIASVGTSIGTGAERTQRQAYEFARIHANGSSNLSQSNNPHCCKTLQSTMICGVSITVACAFVNISSEADIPMGCLLVPWFMGTRHMGTRHKGTVYYVLHGRSRDGGSRYASSDDQLGERHKLALKPPQSPWISSYCSAQCRCPSLGPADYLITRPSTPQSSPYLLP